MTPVTPAIPTPHQRLSGSVIIAQTTPVTVSEEGSE